MPEPKKRGTDTAKQQKRHLVQAAADQLRERVLAAEPDAQIGSLSELAHERGVGPGPPPDRRGRWDRAPTWPPS